MPEEIAIKDASGEQLKEERSKLTLIAGEGGNKKTWTNGKWV